MENIIIQKAAFNPKIKAYVKMVVAFFMFVSVAGIPFLLIWFLGLGQYFSKRFYENLQCELTNRNLQFRKGVLFKVEKTIPLENIQDLTFIQNPLLNAFGLKILKIETAGSSNQHGADMKLIGIVDANEFKQKVMHQREMLTSGNRANSNNNVNNNNQNTELLTQIRDLLKDIKNK